MTTERYKDVPSVTFLSMPDRYDRVYHNRKRDDKERS